MASFEFDSLTLGEVAWIEDYSGMSISSIADEKEPKGKAFIAVATVIKRRTGYPGFNPADAEKLSMSEASALLSQDDADDPKES